MIISKMRAVFIYCTLFFLLVSCNDTSREKNHQDSLTKDTLLKKRANEIDTIKNITSTENNSENAFSVNGEFKNSRIFKLTDTIKTDLNGDSYPDVVYFDLKANKEIFIIDGRSDKKVKAGTDVSFGANGSNFDWAEFWGTTNDKETFEILINDDEVVGERKVKLETTSLFIRKNEVGGGVITFKNGNYIWIHQSD